MDWYVVKTMSDIKENMQKYTRYGYTNDRLNEACCGVKQLYFESEDKLFKAIFDSKELWRPIVAEYHATHTTKKAQAREPLDKWVKREIRRWTDQWTVEGHTLGKSWYDECRMPYLADADVNIYVYGGMVYGSRWF